MSGSAAAPWTQRNNARRPATRRACVRQRQCAAASASAHSPCCLPPRAGPAAASRREQRVSSMAAEVGEAEGGLGLEVPGDRLPQRRARRARRASLAAATGIASGPPVALHSRAPIPARSRRAGAVRSDSPSTNTCSRGLAPQRPARASAHPDRSAAEAPGRAHGCRWPHTARPQVFGLRSPGRAMASGEAKAGGDGGGAKGAEGAEEQPKGLLGKLFVSGARPGPSGAWWHARWCSTFDPQRRGSRREARLRRRRRLPPPPLEPPCRAAPASRRRDPRRRSSRPRWAANWRCITTRR